MRFGVDIGGTKIFCAAIGEDGQEVAHARRRNPAGEYRGALAAVAEAVAETAAAAGVRPDRVGVGICGNVDAAAGQVRFGNATWMTERPLRDDIAETLGVPVRLANDADCFALSEALDGAAENARSVFGVILGTGVGGGFVVDRKLVTGRLGIAGEVGHIPLPRADTDELSRGPCSCGRLGCVETLLSGPSFRADYALANGLRVVEAPEPHEIAERAAAGEPAAEAALERFEERLGRVFGLLANLFEPDVIVLGGGLSNIARIGRNAAAAALPHVFGGRFETRVLRNVHGDSSGVRGAARLWDAEPTA